MLSPRRLGADEPAFPPEGCMSLESFVCAIDRLGGELTGAEALALLLKIVSLARRQIRIAIFCFTHEEVGKTHLTHFRRRLAHCFAYLTL